MTIIERNITGKRSEHDCEDGIVATDDFVAVIDGSTSKTTRRINPEMSNGRYCMTTIANYISNMAAETSLDDFCEGITSTIQALYSTSCSRMREHPEERLCASAIIYSNKRKEIWMIGDCQCMVGGQRYANDKPYEATLARRRAETFVKEQALHPDMTKDGRIIHDYARDAILPEIVAEMRNENHTYAVIDGFPIYREGIKVIRLAEQQTGKAPSDFTVGNGETARTSEIVLASDGYPFLCSTLEKSERKLSRQLAEDPFNISTFKATKGLMMDNVSFDDRAYIRFSTAENQRYFITLSFDGTAYHGWQIQPNGMSVQQKLQDCLSKIMRGKVEVTGAGRTDAGVHAHQMVCHFDAIEGIDCKQLCYRLNNILPRDISCLDVKPVSRDTHARFSATKRSYRYFIHTCKDPFLCHYSVETHYPLDFHAMNKAAAYLLEASDFKAFCKAGADNKTTICNVTTAHWVQLNDTSWYFEISANRFLRNMVRAVVGTLMEVGRGRMSLDRFKDVVDGGSRSDSGESMPAKGLFLWEVEY